MKETVKLIECIRNTWQGEGIDSGQRFTLLRGKYCNRRCNFCDTRVKMKILQEAEYKISDIQKILNEERTNLMITGGEPTFEKHFDDTLKLLNTLNYPLANVESNGYNLYKLSQSIDKRKNIKLIYSPKIFSEKDLEEEIEKTKVLISLDNVFVKVVYQDNKLINNYLKFLDKQIVENKNEYNKVWLMPEGVNRADLIRNSEKVFDACEKFRFNFSTRSHLIYGFI
jgi:organic radical activating enzyme